MGSGRQSRSGLAANGLIIPKHLFEPYKGANSRQASANLKPVGTGPYMFVDFAPSDLVKGERNPAYHVPDRPYFDTIEGVVIPVVSRPQVSAISKKLRATLSGWDSTFWNLKEWYREG